MEFRYLFSPLEVGGTTVPNRVVFPGHGMLHSRDGMVSDRMCYYYVERAKGGAGLIVTEITAPHPSARKYPECVLSYDEKCIPGFAKTARLIHEYGSKFLVQLAHSGGRMSSDDSLMPLWAPSTVKSPIANEVPHQMDSDDMKELLDGYSRSASNVRESGADGVEIHMAHEYLLSEFMSPFTNRRTDEYGGSLDNRLRFVKQVIHCVRESLGKDLILGIKMNGDDFLEGGMTLDDTRQIAASLTDTGEIDYITVSAATSFNTHLNVPAMYMPLGSYVHLAAGIKEVVDVPVIAVGRINDPLQAEKILADGHADMVAVCRGQICDAEWANKARQGQVDDIRKCIACNEGCIGMLFKIRPGTCALNPTASFEQELGIGTIEPAQNKLKVVVIGGGPAGMEAARVAALRGHQVALYEKEDQLGGQVQIAAKAPFRSEIADSIRFLSIQVQKLGVNVNLGVEATPEAVLAENPDAVVVATGSTPLAPQFPGADQDNVVNYWQVLKEEVEVGDNVVLVDDVGHYQALGTAEFLIDQGKKVEIITSKMYVGATMDLMNLLPTYERLLPKGAVFSPLTNLREVSGKNVVVYDVFTGRERTIEGVDTIVTAIGNSASNELYCALRGRVKALHAIGDCAAPRNLLRAIRDGHLAGRSV
jgi:mycofactocin system FadH/OYE family oxidoreductase 2